MASQRVARRLFLVDPTDTHSVTASPNPPADDALTAVRRRATYNAAERRFSMLLQQRFEDLLEGKRNSLELLRKYPEATDPRVSVQKLLHLQCACRRERKGVIKQRRRDVRLRIFVYLGDHRLVHTVPILQSRRQIAVEKIDSPEKVVGVGVAGHEPDSVPKIIRRVGIVLLLERDPSKLNEESRIGRRKLVTRLKRVLRVSKTAKVRERRSRDICGGLRAPAASTPRSRAVRCVPAPRAWLGACGVAPARRR